jgi:transposase
VQQGALRDLDRAFSNFFSGRTDYPCFRRKDTHNTFVIRDVSLKRYNRKYAAILVPKAGYLKFRLTRSWTDAKAATSARVSFKHGQWFVSLTTMPPEKRTGGSGLVGIDRGVTVTAMTSDGKAFQAPTLTAAEQNRFVSLERELARKAKRSKNRECTRLKMGRIRTVLDNRRHDWIEQTTTEIARTYAVVGLERLPVKNLVKRPKPKPDDEGGFLPNGASAKSALAQMIHASLWGKLGQRLSDKVDVIKVPAPNTSRCCYECGHIAAENRKSQAEFRCVRCGHEDNADLNAAKNIRRLAVCGGALREWVESPTRDDTHLQIAS